ncbi:MAG TPA: MarR family winged helix-turn-helix transcriptional regulator [Actinomycetes bacterium]
MLQANFCTRDDDELAVALYAVVLRLRRLPISGPVDKAALAVLHETHRLGAVRPSDLAAQMHLDLSTVSRHLRVLEARGLITRTPDPHDARAHTIGLTDAGGEVLAHLLDQRAVAIRDAIAHWPDEDRHTLRRLVRRLADDLNDCPHETTEL